MKITILVIFVASVCFGQQPYKIPFASTGNTIELAVENRSPQMVEGVKVTAKDIPSWMHITQVEQTLDRLKPNKEKNAVFTFSVDKAAPVNKEGQLRFIISTPSGETWMKEITMRVSSPGKFELFQNYPNPFNPTTIIGYILKNKTHIKVSIYNLLGEEIATLVDEEEAAGYHERVWNASNAASSVYFYQAAYVDEQGKTVLERKRMLLVK